MAGITAYYDTLTNQFIDTTTGLPVAPQDVTVVARNPNETGNTATGITAYYDTMTNQFMDVATGLPVAPQDIMIIVANPKSTAGIFPPITAQNTAAWWVIGGFALIMYFLNKRR